jgi:hypothetical protein
MTPAVEHLSVDVALDVTIEGRECAVWTEGDVVVVNAPSLAAAQSLLRSVDALPVPIPIDDLAAASLTVEVRVRHAPVARVGAGADPDWLTTLAGYEADVSVRGLAEAVWRALL